MKQFSNPIRNATMLVAMILSMCALVAQAQESTDTDAMNSIQSISANNEVGGKIVITVGLKNAPSGATNHIRHQYSAAHCIRFSEYRKRIGKIDAGVR